MTRIWNHWAAHQAGVRDRVAILGDR